MAKLRVADIELDDGSVRIGSRTLVNGLRPQCGPPSNEQTARHLYALKELRVPARFLGWSGAVVAAVGLLLTLWNSAWLDPVGALIRGGFLFPLGAGIVGMALLKRFVENGTVQPDRIALGEDLEEMIGRLSPLLAKPMKHQTVEWIRRQTGWQESATVRLLSYLRDQDQLVEELDPDTGDFYYYVVRQDSRDLDARLADIHTRRMS